MPSPRLALAGCAVLAAAALAACAGRRASPDEPPRPDASGYVSTRNRDHPLVGKIWSPRQGAFVDRAAMDAAVAGARYVLLGETHDNADHHREQARLVGVVAATGRRPALAFEMIDATEQPKLDAAARPGATAPEVARAIGWAESGWPAFGVYRPVFEAGLAAGLRLVGANLPRSAARALVLKGTGTLAEPLRVRLERVGPFPPGVMAALKQQMAESHCGEFPEEMVSPMVLAQKAKDAQLAESLEAADRGDGAILIAGRGHVRDDVGVPRFLGDEARARGVVAIGITEAMADLPAPPDYAAEYGAEALPFDFVVFTPAAVREDQCEKLRAHQAAKRAAEGKPGGEATKAGEEAPAGGAKPAADEPGVSGGAAPPR